MLRKPPESRGAAPRVLGCGQHTADMVTDPTVLTPALLPGESS